jgi:hypothetical protein
MKKAVAKIRKFFDKELKEERITGFKLKFHVAEEEIEEAQIPNH